jgi:hypothetical protein
VTLERDDRADIAHDQHREDDARGKLVAEDVRHDQDMHQAHARKAALRDANPQPGHDREQPVGE